MNTILVLIITFVAMFVQTVAGFGYGSIAVPCCALLMSTNESTALTSTVALVSIIILAIINDDTYSSCNLFWKKSSKEINFR